MRGFLRAAPDHPASAGGEARDRVVGQRADAPCGPGVEAGTEAVVERLCGHRPQQAEARLRCQHRDTLSLEPQAHFALRRIMEELAADAPVRLTEVAYIAGRRSGHGATRA